MKYRWYFGMLLLLIFGYLSFFYNGQTWRKSMAFIVITLLLITRHFNKNNSTSNTI
jgi:hypothetical protein